MEHSGIFKRISVKKKSQVTIKLFMSIFQHTNIKLSKIFLRMWDCGFEDIQCAVTSFIPDF